MSLFVRQLGEEPGVQLNRTRDESEIPALGNADQRFAMIARTMRGRIDGKPTVVDRGTLIRKLGRPEPIRKNALNQAWVVLFEALNNGGYEAVVQRLVSENAIIKWAVISPVDVADFTKGFTFSVADVEPDEGFLLAIKHLECFNDGIRLEVHAEEKTEGGLTLQQDKITLNIRDIRGNLIDSFSGSLDANSQDDFGNSDYLPDVIGKLSDNYEVLVGDITSIPTNSPIYGYDNLSRPKWNKSNELICFDEGGFSYTSEDYLRAANALRSTNEGFGYISSGGSENIALVAELAKLAYARNRHLRLDIPGHLTPDQAIAFIDQVNASSADMPQLLQIFWAPLRANDPSGYNPKGYFATSGFNIGRACYRNSQTNALGFAPKHYPIAGREWPLNRTAIEQTYFPTDQELNRLAKAKITPVIYEAYQGGGLYIFRDILTAQPSNNSLSKLVSVAEIAQDLEERLSNLCQLNEFKPKEIAIERVLNDGNIIFKNAETSGWLEPSNDPAMEGLSFKLVVEPDKERPYDRVRVGAWIHPMGATRQFFVQMTLTR